MPDPSDDFTPAERSVIIRFLHWLLALFGWTPPEPPGEPGDPDPPDEPGENPDEPEPEPEPAPEPFAAVLHPHEWATSGAWAVKDGYVEAAERGDGDELDSTTVTLPEGEYVLTALVFAPDSNSDAFYLGVDNHAQRRWPAVVGEWAVVRHGVGPLAGEHRIAIGTGEVGLIVAAIAVTPTSWTGDVSELLGAPPKLPEPEPPEEPQPEPEPEPEEPTDPNLPPANEPLPTSMLGNPDYDPSDPRDKAGNRITGRALELLRGFEWWRDHPEEHDEWDARDVFGVDDVYMLARVARERGQMLLLHLRAVGDLRSLDAAVSWLNLSRRNLRPGWRGTINPPSGGPSPFPNYIVRGGGQPDDLIGTDLSTMNEVKWYAYIAAVTYALHLNAEHDSPGGLNYAAERDFWLSHLVNEFMPKWRGGGNSGWRGNHTGVRRNGKRTRAREGEWPFVVNGHEGHSTFSSSLLCYYLWRLTGEDGAKTEAQAALTDWLSNTRTADTPQHGTARVWPQTLPSRGSDGWYGQGGAYIGYPSSDVIEHYLEGGFPQIVTTELLQQMAAAVASFFLLDGFGRKGKNDIATTRGICGDEPRGGMPISRTSGPRTTQQVVINSLAILAAWEPNGRTKIADGLEELFGSSFAGTVAQPKNPFASMTLFLKEAGFA